MLSNARISSVVLLHLGCIYNLAAAGYGYPPPVRDTREIRTSYNPNIRVRYKNPSSEICQTAEPDQLQYAGYLHLPPGTLESVQQDYPINSFFWFVEARESPENAPLTIWLNGGPGSSSMVGMFGELGPCEAIAANSESITTQSREWGWDRTSNMLFLDQPNQVGFSYDTPTNGTLPLLDVNGIYMPNTIAPSEFQTYQDLGYRDDDFLTNYYDLYHEITLLNGTFSSGNPLFTSNTTEIAAIAAWHFLQAWVTNFPQYNPNSTGINLMAESYGGIYGPKFFAFFEEQNQRRQRGEISSSDTVELHLETLGIINGCIDGKIQTPSYPIYANGNPYGIEVINDTYRDELLNMHYMDGGCADLVDRCRGLVARLDPEGEGDVEETNRACSAAETACNLIRENAWAQSLRSYHDIVGTDSNPSPGWYFMDYLNNATVQEAIGTPVNYTITSIGARIAFVSTGDFVRGGAVEDIGYLLDNGVRVALYYGDRDFICNYMGGEEVSLAVNYSGSAAFRAAGYEDLRVNGTYLGGQVRQHGNFSFTRIYQAGHLVPYYQPETAFALFDRTLRGVSLATGNNIQTEGDNIYSTNGTANTTQTLVAPRPPQQTCFVRNLGTCTLEEFQMIGGGMGVIINGVLYNNSDEYTGPDAPRSSTSTTSRAPTRTQSTSASTSTSSEDDGNGSAAIGPRDSSMLALVLALGLIICGL